VVSLVRSVPFSYVCPAMLFSSSMWSSITVTGLPKSEPSETGFSQKEKSTSHIALHGPAGPESAASFGSCRSIVSYSESLLTSCSWTPVL